jgi:hypothetical protein
VPWNRRRRAALSVALVGNLVTAGILIARDEAVAAVGRVEVPVASSSPIAMVAETVVRVKVPLPASVGPHPAECDWLSYLRYRHVDGPARSADAHRVLVAQPGVLEGAGAFDSVARNTITAAARSGRHIEFWALDRRSNCLEDNTGVQAGLAAKDVKVAVDYYYRNRPANGRTFGGYLNNDQVTWLQNIGMEQTVRDEYDLLVKELPSQSLRKQKVLCGGHSLGGVITGFFATWDFDRNHATTADAGFNQCAGYFALDTTIATSLADLSGVEPAPDPNPSLSYAFTTAARAGGLLPRTLSGPALINPEMMNLLGVAGLAANVAPDAQSDLAAYLPPNLNVDLTLRFLVSRDIGVVLSGTPNIKDFRFTNQAALGALMDDNSQPLSFLQTSVGFFDGGKVVDKDFPLPNQLTADPNLGLAGFLGTEAKAIPDEPKGPLYTWRNYDRVGAADDPGYRSKTGEPFTSAGEEVSDIRDLARSMSEHPLDFTEDYFPSKILTDINHAAAPEVGRDAVHKNGIKANPAITLLAGGGLLGDPERAPANAIIMNGYQHLDVLTAAAVQNGGKPEPTSTNLAAFAVR